MLVKLFWTPLYTLRRQAILVVLKKALRRKNLEMDVIVNVNVFEYLEEEEDEEIFCTIRRPYILRVKKDHVHCWDDIDFRCRFRLKKETVMIIIEAIEGRLQVICNMYVF